MTVTTPIAFSPSIHDVRCGGVMCPVVMKPKSLQEAKQSRNPTYRRPIRGFSHSVDGNNTLYLPHIHHCDFWLNLYAAIERYCMVNRSTFGVL